MSLDINVESVTSNNTYLNIVETFIELIPKNGKVPSHA